MEEIVIPSATEDPQAYVDALLDVLGDRDPLEVMRATPEAIASVTTGIAPDRLREAPADGEWSAQELLGHWFDVELVYGFRWRLALTEDRPTYPGYDERRWATLPKPSFPELFAAWRALREANVVLLSSVDRAEWQREGVHGEQGGENVEIMVRKFAGHDLAHLNQLERTVEAVTVATTAS